MRISEFLSKISFKPPQPNLVAILYSQDYWIRRLILNEIGATTLEVWPGKVYLTLPIIFCTFGRLWQVRALDSYKKRTLKHLGRQLYASYVLACIDSIGAKVVMTSIDNSSLFQYLSSVDPLRRYFAIQNGTRTVFCVRDSLPAPSHPFSKIRMTNFFCFGQRDVDLFKRHGHEVKNYLSVGSMIGGYYKNVVSPTRPEPIYDLCLISQWHQHLFDPDFINSNEYCRRVSKGISVLLEFLAKFLEETNLTLAIAPRNEDANEIGFYKEIFGNRIEIVKSEQYNFSTYRAIEKSRLAIALNSTVLLEAFSWGHKVLWCNITNDEHYEMPEAGISYFNENDYSAFKQHVQMLMTMPEEEYEQKTRDGARYINNYDSQHPAHEVIRSSVLEALA